MPFNPDTPDGDVSIDKVSVWCDMRHSVVCYDRHGLSIAIITTAALSIIQNIIIILMPNPYILPTPSSPLRARWKLFSQPSTKYTGSLEYA